MDLEYALSLVQRTFEIISYFQPDLWWVETPRYGLLVKHQLISAYPKWDVDYCQFSLCGFKKPTRFFGSLHLSKLPARLCDGLNCRNLGVGRKHLRPLGVHWGAATKKLTYPIPQPVVEIASGFVSGQGKIQALKKRVTFQLPTPPNTPPVGTGKERGGSPRRIGRIRSHRFFSS